MAKSRNRESSDGRARLVDAAYELFAKDGVSRTGIDAILAKSGCAKATLYKNFQSKEELAVAFLDQREKIWTRDWLETEICRRHDSPEGRLLAIFEVFGEWFQKPDFEGCSFVVVLLESEMDSPVRNAAVVHLAKIRSILLGLAKEARLKNPQKFAQAWHMLMKGSIISAGEGNLNAGVQARKAACLVLDGWERT